MQRRVLVGTSSVQLLGKNPERKYFLVICDVALVHVAFAHPATTADTPLYVRGASWELPTLTFTAIRAADPNDAFFQEVNAIGTAGGSAVFVVEG